MKKAPTLLADHKLQEEGTALNSPKRKGLLQKLASPILAACLATCGIATGNDQIEETLQKKQKKAEMAAIGGRQNPGQLLSLGGDPKKGITITIHGINDNTTSVKPLGENATKTGEAVATFAWDDRSRRLTDSANDLAQEVKKVLDANPQSPLTINAHSMGGRMAAVGLARLEQTGALKGKEVKLNLIAPPLQGFSSANMSWVGAGIAPTLRSSLDMGTESQFQKELESIQFQDTQVEVFGGGADNTAVVDNAWKTIATKLAGGKTPTILPNTTHTSAIQDVARILPNSKLAEIIPNAPNKPQPSQNQGILLPKVWEPDIKNLFKIAGTNPSKKDLLTFHRNTQIEAEIQDATNFLIKNKNLTPKTPEAENIRFQTQMEIERIWKDANYNLPPDREKEILTALKTLGESKKLNLVGANPTNQIVDTHRERLAVARDISPNFDPFNGKEDIQESLKSKIQTTTSPKNTGTPTKNVIVVGEKHHDEKNQELYPVLLDTLHKKGFRTLSLELAQDYNKTPLNTLTQELKKTSSSIQQDLLKQNYIQNHGLSKEWIDTYTKAQSLGWNIHFTDKPSKDIAADIQEYENAKETLGNGHELTPKHLEQISKNKNNLGGLPQKTWEELNKLENSHIEKRSKHIGENLARIPGKILHIGGSQHTSEVQDSYAEATGKRPLGLQIDYTPPKNLLQQIGKKPSQEEKMEKQMEKHLDINKRTAKHSKHCFELPINPKEAIKTLENLTQSKGKTPPNKTTAGPEM